MADLNRVIEILKENKVDEAAIGQFVVSLNNMLAQQIEMEIVSTLGEKDFKALNELEEKEAHKEISRRYKIATGVTMEQKTQEILDGFVTGFLSEYHRGKLQEKKG